MFFVFLKSFFLMRTIKILVEFVTILLLVISFFNVFNDFLALGHEESQLADQGLNPQPLHWKVKSQPWDHQGSLKICLSKKISVANMQYEKTFSLENIVKYILIHTL